MTRDRFHDALRCLGLPVDRPVLLMLLPAVYVAWADWVIEASEREKIAALARREYGFSDADLSVIEQWLLWRPSPEYFREGFRLLLACGDAPDEPSIQHSDLPRVLAHAEAISRTRNHGDDRPSRVDLQEERALADLAIALRLDHGRPWSALVRELNETAAAEPHHAAAE